MYKPVLLSTTKAVIPNSFWGRALQLVFGPRVGLLQSWAQAMFVLFLLGVWTVVVFLPILERKAKGQLIRVV